MKLKYLLTLAFAAFATVAMALPNPTDMPILRTDGDPNNVVYALKGQLIADVSSPAIYYQAAASGTTGMVLLVNTSGAVSNPTGVTIPAAGALTLSGTAHPAGSLIVSATNLKLYITGSSGQTFTGVAFP